MGLAGNAERQKAIGPIRLLIVLVAALVLGGLLPVGAPRPAGASEPVDRYALAGGCWSLGAKGPVVRSLRFQATDLGRYLLVTDDGRFVAADGAATTLAAMPSPAAEWDAADGAAGAVTFRSAVGGAPMLRTGAGALVVGAATDAPTAFEPSPATGCVMLPDIDTGVTGPQAHGSSAIEEVRGFLDAHLHITAFEFLGGKVHCGRPWHPYGVAYALVDCPDHQVADGAAAVVENLLGGGDPVAQHDPVGWPTFRDWPAPRSLTHEQTYHRWLERAWRGGVRMIVNLVTDNRVLCELYPLKQNSCDEMDAVHLQVQRIHELERYLDAQAGGPGKGWLRIVTDPYEARAVINAGKLAVVLGIELSEPFGCRSLLGAAQCTAVDIDRQIDELHALGIRQMFAIHKFDNALGGVTGDGGASGPITNTGNLLSTGHFLDMETCDPGGTGAHDHAQGLPIDARPATDGLGAVLADVLPPGVSPVPVYPPPEHCNTRALTDLGRHAVETMIDRGVIIDVDHMSVRARQQALDLIESAGHSGVISSHSWGTPDADPRVLAAGGLVTPYAGDSTDFVEQWRRIRPLAPAGFAYGIGYGADMNGLGGQGRPRGGPDPVRYPFTGFGGTTIERQRSGSRVFDINVDGVAHYGLYPDWIEDLRHLAGDQIVDDLARGPEAYLQMWERADGVPRAPACPASGGRDALAAVRRGMSAQEVLRAAGQPTARAGDTFTYCDVVIGFDRGGQVATVLSGAGAAVPAEPATPAELPATGGGAHAVGTLGAVLVAGWVLTRALGRGTRPSAR